MQKILDGKSPDEDILMNLDIRASDDKFSLQIENNEKVVTVV